ncbi:MAG: hypothetical protein PHP82_00130 [Candidatus ainarchaeum sp.]|nr:hypothetical protein [Candidatus ainarchaeum sp.]
MKKNIKKEFVAQGTIEYLTIIGVIVVIGLVVVSLLTNVFDDTQNISSTTTKISSITGIISISETIVDNEGNGLIVLSNNSNETLTIKSLSINGVNIDYPNTILTQSVEKIFSLNSLDDNCSCVGFEGKMKTCEITIYYTSKYGLEKQVTTNIVVDCVDEATPKNLSNLILPTSSRTYEIMFNIKNSSTNLHLTDFNINCNDETHNFTNQESPTLIDFNGGVYSCDFSKLGYDSNNITINANSDKNIDVYLTQQSELLSNCGTLDAEKIYFLENDIGSGENCLIIESNNILINGNSHTITGNIVADGAEGIAAYTGLSLSNINVVGTVSAIGGGGSNTAGSGGTVTVTNNSNITTINTTGGWNTYSTPGEGGAVTITDSNVETITTTGGAGHFNRPGEIAGAVTLTNSIIETITAKGGNGTYSGGKAGGIITANNSVIITIDATGGSGGHQGAGGAGGTITLTDSNIVTIISLGGNGAYGATAGAGGTITLTDSNTTTITATGGSSSGPGGAGGTITLTNSNIKKINTIGGNGNYGGVGGNVNIISQNLDLSNIEIDINYGSGDPHHDSGTLILNFSNSFTDTGASYNKNLKGLKIVRSGVGEIYWNETSICEGTPDNSNCSQWGGSWNEEQCTRYENRGGQCTWPEHSCIDVSGGDCSNAYDESECLNNIYPTGCDTWIPGVCEDVGGGSCTGAWDEWECIYMKYPSGCNWTPNPISCMYAPGPGCVEGSFSCDDCINESSCSVCGGWWGSEGGICEGTGSGCEGATNSMWCNDYSGCEWSLGWEEGICEGTGSGCEDLNNYNSCWNYSGCSWFGDPCTGTVTCEAQISLEACQEITGCAYSASSIDSSSFTNLSNNIIIEQNSVYLNSTAIPSLNIDANITLYLTGLEITNPQVLKDGIECNSPSCEILSYDSEIIIFRVTSWDNAIYTIAESS